jgi:hypothetical protein
VKTSVKLDALQVITYNGVEQTRHEHFFGQLPSYIKYLRTWGEAGTIKIRADTDPKLKETSGVVCKMIGYANHHSGETYQMFDPVSRRVYITRDVQWLGRMFWNKHEDAIDDNYYTIDMPEQLKDRIRTMDETEHEQRMEEVNEPDPVIVTTRAGRHVNPPTFLQDYETGFFTKAEVNYYQNLMSIGELTLC